jgi:hypothetical protein
VRVDDDRHALVIGSGGTGAVGSAEQELQRGDSEGGGEPSGADRG